MNKVLIVEDHKDIAEMLKSALQNAGYQVDWAETGMAALDLLRAGAYEIVLLDIMLPYKSGDEVLREMRGFTNVPAIVISAKDMTGTKIDLLRLGADDYITKPFDLNEVLARMETVLRRARPDAEEKTYQYKSLLLSVNSKEVTVAGVALRLTAKEYKILELLLSHQTKVFTKASLYEAIWEEEYLGDENVVKMHISNIRAKIKEVCPGEEYIETVWGLGYRLYRKEG